MAKRQDIAARLYEALREMYEGGILDAAPRSYSGRYMYGKRGIGIDLANSGDIFRLGAVIGANGDDLFEAVPNPNTDSMGRGIIAYWPNLEWDPETMSEGDGDEDADRMATYLAENADEGAE